MGNGNGPGFSFSRPGGAPASLPYGKIATIKQAVDGGYKGQELQGIEIPKVWLARKVRQVFPEGQGGPE